MSLEYLLLLDCTCTTDLIVIPLPSSDKHRFMFFPHLTGRSWSYLNALRHRIEHQCPYVIAGENHEGQEDSSTYRSACHHAPMSATIFPTVPYTTNLVFLPLTCIPVSPGFQHHSASYMSCSWLVLSLPDIKQNVKDTFPLPLTGAFWL